MLAVAQGAPPQSPPQPPDPVEDLTRRSRERTEADDFAGGLHLARQALAAAPPRSPAAARARAALGEALFRAGDLEGAGAAFRRSLGESRDHAETWSGLARVLLTVPDYQGAGQALRKAQALAPDDAKVLRRLAGLVVSREESLALYRRYLELPAAEDPEVIDNVRAWVALLEHVGERKLYRLEGPGDGAHAVGLARVGGVPWVEASVGGLAPRRFLLDSGASGVTVPATMVQRLELKHLAEFTIRGVSGATDKAPFVLLPALSVGPFTFHDVPAVAVKGAGDAPAILGLSLLAPLAPAREEWRRLSLARDGGAPAGCPRQDWWRLRPVGGILRVDATLDGAPLRLALDTGAARSALSRAALERLEVEVAPGGPALAIRGITGAARDVGRVRRSSRLAFPGDEVNARGLPVLDLSALSRSAGSEIDGILGVDLLGSGTYQVDHGAGRLRVGPKK